MSIRYRQVHINGRRVRSAEDILHGEGRTSFVVDPEEDWLIDLRMSLLSQELVAVTLDMLRFKALLSIEASTLPWYIVTLVQAPADA